MRRYHSLLVRLASAAVLASSVAACNGVGEEFQRGYVVDERAIAQVKKGMSADQVLQTLGTPSTVSTVGNRNWYYISQRILIFHSLFSFPGKLFRPIPTGRRSTRKYECGTFLRQGARRQD